MDCTVFILAQEVQWQFVHGLFELAIYGGRVDNPFDVNVMISYLAQFFEAGTLSPQSKNKRLGPIRLPSSTNYRVRIITILSLFQTCQWCCILQKRGMGWGWGGGCII